LILEQLVDDGALARTGCLEEGDLALRFKGDDLRDGRACDRGFANEMGRAFLDNVAAGAQARRKKQTRVARLTAQGEYAHGYGSFAPPFRS
jgi:hypothetical protein